jgi:hypothetical protein
MLDVKNAEDNIRKAQELLWTYCEKCPHHTEEGCKRDEGVCEVDEAWEYLDAVVEEDEK